MGGGDTHRFNLSDAVLIKDNHIKILGLEECLRRAKSRASFTKKIEVEVENYEDMLLAATSGADIIMFDNMSPSQISEGMRLLSEKGTARRSTDRSIRRHNHRATGGVCGDGSRCDIPWLPYQKRKMDRPEFGDGLEQFFCRRLGQ